MYIVRKPESIRSPALQRSANTTSTGTRNFFLSPLRLTGSSPAWASALAGSRIERIVAPAKTTNAKRSDHCEPNVEARPASGAAIEAPMIPAREIRLFALTSVSPGGTSRGTVAARATPYALEETRTPRAVGNIAIDWVATASAISQHRKARRAMVPPIAHRRPWLNRSRKGPSRGATIANGSIVRPRKSATCPRASPGWAKNRVPASEMATVASPAALNACSSISR